ncbi:MAG: NUDIX domain-containing protein [Archangium sp.]|nr:NUDIX domain-containing protein [Archangium sp.]
MASDREPIPTWYFALVVVRRGADEFLVVHERKHGQRFYFPAGRAEVGETLQQAALRETKEEAGIDVTLEGVLRFEHSPSPDGTARVRVVFLARPTNPNAALKSVADEHSLCARWVRLNELDVLPLRGDDVREVFTAVASGRHVAPLTSLADELESWT